MSTSNAAAAPRRSSALSASSRSDSRSTPSPSMRRRRPSPAPSTPAGLSRRSVAWPTYKVIKDIEIKKPDPPPPKQPKPAPSPEVAVRFSIWPCCCQLCTYYQPHPGCCPRCSSAPASQTLYYGGYPFVKVVCDDEPSYGCSIV